MRAFSPVESAKAAARTAAQGLNRFLARHSGASNMCLVVAQDPEGRKTQRTLENLRFAFYPVAIEGRVRVVRKPTLLRILLARTVVEVDEGLVPVHYDRRFGHVFHVDFDRNPAAAWQLARIAQFVAGLPTEDRRAEARSRLTEGIRRIRSAGKKKAYIFGTGPSLANALDRDFSDGYKIVCNTIVRDDALWFHLAPDLIAAGDAIYHFGHAAHAQAFRADLKRRLTEAKGRTLFVYPEVFDAIVRREFAGLEDSLIPIPFGKHTDVHVDLCERFELPNLGNVLNILLLPLACTLSTSVWLWGFDGRAPDDRLFWSNSSRHAYPELMPALLEEHPAFFAEMIPKGRESNYVNTVHGDALEERLRRAEAEGFQFTMMHFSWTETLNRRALKP